MMVDRKGEVKNALENAAGQVEDAARGMADNVANVSLPPSTTIAGLQMRALIVAGTLGDKDQDDIVLSNLRSPPATGVEGCPLKIWRFCADVFWIASMIWCRGRYKILDKCKDRNGRGKKNRAP